MDIKRFDKAIDKLGGRFRATSLIRKRLREIIQAGFLKDTFNFDAMVNKILDEIISGQISIKDEGIESTRKTKKE